MKNYKQERQNHSELARRLLTSLPEWWWEEPEAEEEDLLESESSAGSSATGISSSLSLSLSLLAITIELETDDLSSPMSSNFASGVWSFVLIRRMIV